MRERRTGGRAHGALSGAFVFLLLAGFALLTMLVIAVGAQVYRSIARTAGENYGMRTALSYVAGKVRAADARGAVAVEDHDGLTVLVLAEAVDGRAFNTYIYCRDGSLQEYFGAAKRAFNPALGEALLGARALDAALEKGLLDVTVTDEAGGTHALALYLQSGGGEAP